MSILQSISINPKFLHCYSPFDFVFVYFPFLFLFFLQTIQLKIQFILNTVHVNSPFRARIMKWLAVICGAISVGCLSYLAYKKYRAWHDRREMLRAVEELRAARGKVKTNICDQSSTFHQIRPLAKICSIIFFETDLSILIPAVNFNFVIIRDLIQNIVIQTGHPSVSIPNMLTLMVQIFQTLFISYTILDSQDSQYFSCGKHYSLYLEMYFHKFQ